MSSLPVSSSAGDAAAPYDGYYFNTHAFSVGLNEFMDSSTDALKEFDDHPEMKTVATQIVTRLLQHHDVPLSDSRHPFNKYARPTLTDFENRRRLALLIMADFSQSPSIRSYVVSFFHSGGCNREWMEELFDEFLEWVEESTDEPSQPSQESESDDSDSDSEPSEVPPMPSFVPMLLHSSLATHVDETAVV